MSNDLKNIRKQSIEELVLKARSYGIDNAGNMRKSDLIFELICAMTSQGKTIRGEGVLEILSEGFGFLRSPVSDFGPGTDDIYVSPAQIRRFNLRNGDFIRGKARTPREGERYLALLQIELVNGLKPEVSRDRLLFDTLSIAAHSELVFHDETLNAWASQIGLKQGQRILVRYAKGASCVRPILSFLQQQDVNVVYLSISTPPEDIPYLASAKHCTPFLSSMGEGSSRHLQVANLALMRAKRLAEAGEDVVLVFDSVWSYLLNAQEQIEQQGKKGAMSLALSMFRYFWGAARRLQNGSLSIYALLPEAFGATLEKVQEEILDTTHHELMISSEWRDHDNNPFLSY